MVPNVGAVERAIRIAVGAGLLSVVFIVHGPWRWVGLIGVLPLISGILGWCPLYAYLTQD